LNTQANYSDDSPQAQHLSNGADYNDENEEDEQTEPIILAPPVVMTAKEEKVEKKRLEKEKKDREKKEKEDAKRAQKESEKQKKDAAKGVKSPEVEATPEVYNSRKEERDVKKAKKSLFSLPREGVRPRSSVQVRILLLDGSDFEIPVDVCLNDLTLLFVMYSIGFCMADRLPLAGSRSVTSTWCRY